MDKKDKIIPFMSQQFNVESARKNNLLGKKLEAARKRKHLSQRDLIKGLSKYGLSIQPAAYSKWETGMTVPNSYQLMALCFVLQITDGISYFADVDSTLELDERGMRKLNEYKQDLIATGLYKPKKKIEYIEMPVSLQGAAAGTGIFMDDECFVNTRVPANTVPYGADFGVHVSGDSMEPTYQNGQLIWIQRTSELLPGQVGLFVYEGKGFVKSYDEQIPEDPEMFTDSYGNVHMQPVLVSYNEAYSNIEINPNLEFKIVGRVLN